MRETILFFQTEIHNYHLSLYRELITKHNFEIVVFYSNTKYKTPYVQPEMDHLTCLENKGYSKSYLCKFAIELNPKLIRTSGWSDISYVLASRKLKRLGFPVVVVSDTQWRNELKQTIGAFLFGKFIRKSFTKIMVAGPYQFEYARKLGFEKNKIIFNNLSADTEVFNSLSDIKDSYFSKTFLYVGRIDEKRKGVVLMLEAWNSISYKNGWDLKIIGNGIIDEKYGSNYTRLNFIASQEIFTIMQNSAFLVIPSTYEPWAVVAHEAALSSVAILSSDSVGAIPLFLINGFNGYIFENNNMLDLRKTMEKAMNLSQPQILNMKNNSRELGNRISTRISAASLISVIS